MRSCLARLLKPGHKSKTKATDYSKQVDSNHRTVQERIWVDILKVFKFSMSKIEINNFKMHYDVLECNFFIEWKVPYVMKSFLDVYCSQNIPASTGTFIFLISKSTSNTYTGTPPITWFSYTALFHLMHFLYSTLCSKSGLWKLKSPIFQL